MFWEKLETNMKDKLLAGIQIKEDFILIRLALYELEIDKGFPLTDLATLILEVSSVIIHIVYIGLCYC